MIMMMMMMMLMMMLYLGHPLKLLMTRVTDNLKKLIPEHAIV